MTRSKLRWADRCLHEQHNSDKDERMSAFEKVLVNRTFQKPSCCYEGTSVERGGVFVSLKELENVIHYQFKRPELMEQAMRHSSYCNEHQMKKTECNERLEFLGDAVLELVSSEYLYRKMPDLPEGALSKTRASKVCEPALAMCARRIGVDREIIMGKGEEHTGGRNRDSIVSDALESLIGAIYLDGGFANAKEFILSFIMIDINTDIFYDSKTTLQEIVQREYRLSPTYHLVREEGPEHERIFTMEVRIGDEVFGIGSGPSKKNAQQEAAKNAILRIRK